MNKTGLVKYQCKTLEAKFNINLIKRIYFLEANGEIRNLQRF